MNQRLTIRKTRTAVIAVGFVLFTGLALWAGGKSLHASSRKPNRADRFRAKLQAGVGSQVSFAQTASPDEVRASVDAIDSFIAGRSGLKLDPASKAKLVQMESEALGGQRNRVSVKGYVNALADTLLERMASLTDDEIDYAGSNLKTNGRISLRLNGRFGISDDEFAAEARKLCEQSRGGDPLVRSAIRDGLSEEVEKRMGALRDAVPAQFGVVNRHGLTPAQAVLLTYSVITDDDLTLTQMQISNLAKNPALPRRAADGTIPEDARVYGPNGRFFATPADLVFNSATIDSLLDRLAKGGN